MSEKVRGKAFGRYSGENEVLNKKRSSKKFEENEVK